MLAPSLSTDKSVKTDGYTVSDIFAFAMLAYSIGKFFGGPLADGVGGKNLMMIALTAIAFGNFFVSRTTDLGSFVIVWSVARFFHAFCHPSVTRLCKAWFKDNNFSTAYSILMAAPITGSVSASFFLGPIIASSYGWQGCMQISAVVVTTMLIILTLFLKKEPSSTVSKISASEESAKEKSEGASEKDAVDKISTFEALLIFYRNPRYWLCLLGACLLTVLYEFQSLLPLFLSEHHHLDAQTSSMMLSAFSIGGVLSLLAFGSIYDTMSKKTRYISVFFMLLLSAVCLKFLTVVSSPLVLIVLIFTYSSCVGPIYNLVPSMFGSDLAGEHFIGTIFSSLDVPSYLSAMLFFKSYPWLIATGQWELVMRALMVVASLALVSCVGLLYLESRAPTHAIDISKKKKKN